MSPSKAYLAGWEEPGTVSAHPVVGGAGQLTQLALEVQVTIILGIEPHAKGAKDLLGCPHHQVVLRVELSASSACMGLRLVEKPVLLWQCGYSLLRGVSSLTLRNLPAGI